MEEGGAGGTSSVLNVRGRDGEDMGGAGQKGDEDVLELHVELGEIDCLRRLGACY